VLVEREAVCDFSQLARWRFALATAQHKVKRNTYLEVFLLVSRGSKWVFNSADDDASETSDSCRALGGVRGCAL